MTEITTIPERSTALTDPQQANPIAAMLQAVVEKGITAESTTAMEKLVELYERVEDRNAAKAFAAAKAALQADLPAVQADKIIPTKSGEIRSTFASYEQIMEAIQPFLVKHGFAVSFDIDVEQGPPPRMTAICKLTHVAGHTEKNKFSVRVGQGPPGASEAQADGAARSYARRGALCDALNIVIDHDTDARNLGSFITPTQAANLRARVEALGQAVNLEKFFAFAKAQSFETIHEGMYAAVDDALRRMERTKKPGNKDQAGSDEDPEALDKQDFVIDCRNRKVAATSAADLNRIIEDIRQRTDWLGADNARKLIEEIRR